MPGLLLVPLAMVVFVSGAQARPSAPVTTADDVRELGRSIEQIHPDPFRSVSQQRFESEVNALAQRAPSLSRNELLVGVLRLIALLGPRNGHTGLFPRRSGAHAGAPLLPAPPLRLRGRALRRGRRGRVARPQPPRRDRRNPGRKVLDLVEPLVPRDNDSNLRGLAPHFALTAEVLDGLGITDGSPASFTLDRPDGQRVDVPLDGDPGARATSRSSPTRSTATTRRSSRAPRSRCTWQAAPSRMWVRTLAGGKAVYVGYNSVRSPSPSFLRTLGRLARAPSTKRVIVDVRLNGGGDNTTYGPLTTLFGSSAVNKRGKLYLLTGRATFSAAANFAAEIDRDTRAIIVGEPTGGGVETYGDTFPSFFRRRAGRFTSPRGTTSARKARTTGGSRSSRMCRVDLDVRAVLRGPDPVLERALRGL